METFAIENNTTVVNTTDVIHKQSNDTSVLNINDGVHDETKSSNGQDLANVCAIGSEQTKSKSRLFDLVGMDSPVTHRDEEVTL